MTDFQPKAEHKFTFGLWTVGNIGRDPFGGPVREQKSPGELVHLLAEVGAWGVNFHDNGYDGSHHFDAHAYRTEDCEGVKDFARGCMRTYLILREKAAQWNQDEEIQALVAEINADDGSMNQYFGNYSAEKASALKNQSFDRTAISSRGLKYERLDQLTVELLLGVR